MLRSLGSGGDDSRTVRGCEEIPRQTENDADLIPLRDGTDRLARFSLCVCRAPGYASTFSSPRRSANYLYCVARSDFKDLSHDSTISAVIYLFFSE